MVLGDRSYRLKEDIGIGNPCNFKGTKKTLDEMQKRFFEDLFNSRKDDD